MKRQILCLFGVMFMLVGCASSVDSVDTEIGSEAIETNTEDSTQDDSVQITDNIGDNWVYQDNAIFFRAPSGDGIGLPCSVYSSMLHADYSNGFVFTDIYTEDSVIIDFLKYCGIKYSLYDGYVSGDSILTKEFVKEHINSYASTLAYQYGYTDVSVSDDCTVYTITAPTDLEDDKYLASSAFFTLGALYDGVSNTDGNIIVNIVDDQGVTIVSNTLFIDGLE